MTQSIHYGNSCDILAIAEVYEKFNIQLIEGCAL